MSIPAGEAAVEKWLAPVSDRPGNFRATVTGRDEAVEFVPFYRLHRHTYSIYWDLAPAR